MKKRAFIFVLTVALLLFLPAAVYAGLKTLMKLGNNQSAIARHLKKETIRYNKVKEAILKGRLEEGMPADNIRGNYGDPIIESIYDEKRNAYRWLYMPASSSHFEGEKLYLFIDKENLLVGWRLIEN